MAVIAKYVVVRNGVELEPAFTNKKEAEAYDSMLDAAEGLATLIEQGNLQIDVDPQTIEAISVHLAKNAPAVMQILKPVKPFKPTPGDTPKTKPQTEPGQEKDRAKESRAKAKNKSA